MPEFKEHSASKLARKQEELAPYIEKAFARRKRMMELSDDEILNVIALGRQITQPHTEAEQEARRAWSERSAVPLKDPAKKLGKGAAE